MSPSAPTSTSAPPSSPAASSPGSPAATEYNPPGDIPDNAVFIDHAVAGTPVHLSVPEGWARTTSGSVTTWTDKYNSISIEVKSRASAPTVASARAEDVPALQASVPQFKLTGIAQVTLAHGPAVHLTYLMDSPPDPVTTKVVRDAVEQFDFWQGGTEAVLSLAGPQNADNVDPWKTVSDSLAIK
jgi:hypothetical protein